MRVERDGVVGEVRGAVEDVREVYRPLETRRPNEENITRGDGLRRSLCPSLLSFLEDVEELR